MELEAFGDYSLCALMVLAAPGKSLLFVKPTNRVAHAGPQRIAPGSSEEATWLAWVKHLAGSQARSVNAGTRRVPAEQTVLRRLTHSQYDSTVRDLLDDNTFPSRQFPPEDFIDGFQNQYEAQSISPLLAEAYSAAAERLAAAFQPLKARPRFVDEFGAKAFRRPLTA